MVKYRIKNRHRFKEKQIRALRSELKSIYGMEPDLSSHPVDGARWGDWDVVLLANDIICMRTKDGLSYSVKGLLSFAPESWSVTVDMGAVPYVYNGADVMSPGIVEADQNIAVGNLVWVRDQKNRRPLAVGRALISGADMVEATSGKAIETLHHVGDPLWEFGEDP